MLSIAAFFFALVTFYIKPLMTRPTNSVKAPIIEPVEYRSTRELFNEIRAVLAQHPGLRDDAVQKLAYFTFAVLFADFTNILPCVTIVAPDPAASSFLLRLLETIHANPLHLGEVTVSSLLSLPPSPRRTLLIDQLLPNKELLRLLRIMSRPGGRVPWRGTLHDLFCPAVVCTSRSLNDPVILEQSIQIVLDSTRSRLPNLDPTSMSKVAHRLRGMLEKYRQENLASVRDSKFDAPQLRSPTREIAIMLGSSIVGDPELAGGVVSLMEGQDRDTCVRHWSSIESAGIEAVLFLSHEHHRQHALVGESATVANGILKGRGETFEISSRAMGDVLRSVGLFTQRLGPAGRGIMFLTDTRRKIHALGWSHNVLSIQDGVDHCRFCAEARSQFGREPSAR